MHADAPRGGQPAAGAPPPDAHGQAAADPASAQPDDEAARLRGTCDQLRRALANEENARKRAERAAGDRARRAEDELLCGLLPVVDDLERAQQALDAADGAADAAALLAGVENIHKAFRGWLAARGVQPIETDGAFDVRWHEAVAAVPAPDAPAGNVIGVERRGYRRGDSLLRAARVIVAKEADGP